MAVTTFCAVCAKPSPTHYCDRCADKIEQLRAEMLYEAHL